MRRLVLEEGDLCTILGVLADGEEVPSILHFADAAVSLIRVKPRYCLYHVVQELKVGVFNEFHPSQV